MMSQALGVNHVASGCASQAMGINHTAHSMKIEMINEDDTSWVSFEWFINNIQTKRDYDAWWRKLQASFEDIIVGDYVDSTIYACDKNGHLMFNHEGKSVGCPYQLAKPSFSSIDDENYDIFIDLIETIINILTNNIITFPVGKPNDDGTLWSTTWIAVPDPTNRKHITVPDYTNITNLTKDQLTSIQEMLEGQYLGKFVSKSVKENMLQDIKSILGNHEGLTVSLDDTNSEYGQVDVNIRGVLNQDAQDVNLSIVDK